MHKYSPAQVEKFVDNPMRYPHKLFEICCLDRAGLLRGGSLTINQPGKFCIEVTSPIKSGPADIRQSIIQLGADFLCLQPGFEFGVRVTNLDPGCDPFNSVAYFWYSVSVRQKRRFFGQGLKRVVRVHYRFQTETLEERD